MNLGPVPGPGRHSELRVRLKFHRTTLNFAGGQCDYFIIMIIQMESIYLSSTQPNHIQS
jgi:hypothetical protein